MYHKTVLKNGIRIVSERLEHFRSVSLGIWVNVGSRDEVEEKNGISHFIEHMTFKGTHKRNSLQIAKELDAIGGYSNAFTGAESTCFHSRVLDKHFQTLADILSDIFLNSLFDPQDMNRERQVILQEINMLEDTPDEQVHVLFNEFFWLNHPLGMPIMGTPSTVAAMNKQTVLDHIRCFYTPNRIIVAAAGNEGNDSPNYPAYYQNSVAVAALCEDGSLAPLSNYGENVDVAAPGFNIYSTLPGNTYGYKSGTSFAAAYVSGMAALLFPLVTDENGNGFLNDEVRAAIESGCESTTISGTGKGIINASGSLDKTGYLMELFH